MAYVPGFDNDVFVSYAHGDDREWIDRLLDRLKPTLKRLLGVEPSIWVDESDLRRTRDYRKEIPSSIDSSAVFILFASPSYIRSEYCVRQESPRFQATTPSKRARFARPDFANELFAVRCLLLPVDDNEHWQLFPGLTDIPFCDESDTFPIGSRELDVSLRRLTGELALLLKRMRNQSTPVFLYPPRPRRTLCDVHEALSAELTAQSYRLLPDRLVNIPDQLREAALSIFLLDDMYDEMLRELAQAAAKSLKPWIVWCSPEIADAAPEQLGLTKYLEELDSLTKTYLDPAVSSTKLKEIVLDVLRPSIPVISKPAEKPRVYLLYNSRDRTERSNAGQIAFHYRGEFQFDHPDDPAQHSARLASSDGVLLVWGQTDEKWCAPEFETMIQVSRRARARGLCLFDPAGSKMAVADEIKRRAQDVHVLEQFGRFDPARMEPFFNPIRRDSVVGAP